MQLADRPSHDIVYTVVTQGIIFSNIFVVDGTLTGQNQYKQGIK